MTAPKRMIVSTSHWKCYDIPRGSVFILQESRGIYFRYKILPSSSFICNFFKEKGFISLTISQIENHLLEERLIRF